MIYLTRSLAPRLDFTICQTFSRDSYLQLQEEFPEVKFRLKQGLNHYKMSQVDRIVQAVKKQFCSTLSYDEVKNCMRANDPSFFF